VQVWLCSIGSLVRSRRDESSGWFSLVSFNCLRSCYALAAHSAWEKQVCANVTFVDPSQPGIMAATIDLTKNQLQKCCFSSSHVFDWLWYLLLQIQRHCTKCASSMCAVFAGVLGQPSCAR